MAAALQQVLPAQADAVHRGRLPRACAGAVGACACRCTHECAACHLFAAPRPLCSPPARASMLTMALLPLLCAAQALGVDSGACSGALTLTDSLPMPPQFCAPGPLGVSSALQVAQ